MKVTYCLHELSSWQQHPLQDAPGSLAPCAPQLGHSLCSTSIPTSCGCSCPAFYPALLGSVLPWHVPLLPWLGAASPRAAAAVGPQVCSWAVLQVHGVHPPVGNCSTSAVALGRSSCQMVSPVVWVFSLLLFCCFKI